MKSPMIPIAAACMLWLCAVAAFAQAPPSAPSTTPAHPASLEQAVKHVQHKTHGHILAADSVARGRTTVYRIKVLTPQGQVKVVQLHSPPKPSSSTHDSDQGGY